MARKRRSHTRKKRRNAAANPRKKRRNASAPRRRSHRRVVRRNAARNPSRRRKRTSHRRAAPRRKHKRHTHWGGVKRHRRRVNPKRRASHRRRRRNPNGIPFMPILKGVGMTTVSALAVQAISYLATPAADVATKGQMYRSIVGGVGVLGGAFLAKKSPLLGISLVAGSVIGAWGGFLQLKMFGLLPPKQAPAQQAPPQGAVFVDNLSGYYQQLSGYQPVLSGYQQQLNAVYADDMSAVYADDMSGVVPNAPWRNPGPFG